MSVLRQMLGKMPNTPNGRVRNHIANRHLGTTQAHIFENILNPGASVPWHRHATEEVIVVLDGRGEYHTEAGAELFSGGDVLLIAAGTIHALRNMGDVPIRQICVFPDDPMTEMLQPEVDGHAVEDFHTH
jgi:quercetin dioxygenase-like cupin family protein